MALLTVPRPALNADHKPTSPQIPAAVARLSVDLPADTLAALKAHVAQSRTSVKAVVIRLIEAELGWTGRSP